ncbi:serine protease, partial [Streptomyces sp. UNOC14_S4]|uniref:trypsin-like serine peptidase n=1 Tax=Streptomyces sp. UNOC14_S4 TaxID=2872340 RepID=UPI001E3CDB72
MRISTPDGGTTLGAGVLVTADTVLTCAHVIPWDGVEEEPDGEVLAEFVGVPGSTAVLARVAEGCWEPERPDTGGADVALLRLAEPQAAEHTAPLQCVAPTPGRAVTMCGFPSVKPLNNGVYLSATIAGPNGEWVQLDPGRAEHAVRPGFSGAGVTDVETRHVLGMIVSRYDDASTPVFGGPRLRLSYMIPIETVASYLPKIAELVKGWPPNDLPSVPDPRDRPPDPEFARWLARWFGRATGMRDVEVVVIRKGQTERAATLGRAVALAGREMVAEARTYDKPRAHGGPHVPS